MKVISIKTQKLLSYIPIVNWSVFFIGFFNFKIAHCDYKTHFKGYAPALLAVIPLSIIRISLQVLFAEHLWAVRLVNVLFFYLSPLVLARIIICTQKKYIQFE